MEHITITLQILLHLRRPSNWMSAVISGTVNATITNYYGLKLNPPSATTGLTITNNYGVYSGWSSSTNYFAGNVGIGTDNPRSGLEVQGTDGARITRALTGGNFSGYKFHINNPSGNTFNLNVGRVFNDNVATSLFNITNNGDIVPAASGQIDLGSSSITWDNIYGETLYTDDKIVHRGDTNTSIGFPAADTFTVETAGTERVRVSAGGNVGIGSTIPTAKLDVNGTVNVTGVSTFNDNIIATSTFTIGDVDSISGGAPIDQGVIGVYGTGRNMLTIQTNDNTQDRGISFRNNGDKYAGFIALTDDGNNKTDMIFGLAPTTTVTYNDVDNVPELLRLTNQGTLGIGTDNPETLLTVAAPGSSAQIEIKRTNSNASGAIGALNFTAMDGHSVANIFAQGDGDNEGADLVFKTTSAAAENDPYGSGTIERVRITSGGNVGIGTDDPSGLLEIESSSTTDMINLNVSNANFAKIGHNSASGVDVLDVRSEGHMRFLTGGNNERLRITSTGELRFQNTMASTPYYIHMQVTGTNTIGGGGGIQFDTSASNNASNNGLYLAQISGERSSSDDGSNSLIFKTTKAGAAGDDSVTHSPKTRMIIDEDGDVTISDGNLIVADGHGISFAATADSGGTMSSEVFDDYEEGTFTPT